VAQGTLSIGGISGGTEGASVQKNHPTVGTIVDGALVEREAQVRQMPRSVGPEGMAGRVALAAPVLAAGFIS